VDLCGLFKFGEYSDAEVHMKEILNDVDITDNPILLKCSIENESEIQIKAALYHNDKLEEIDYQVVEESTIYKEFFVARLLGYLEVASELQEAAIRRSMTNIRKKLASGNVLFELQGKRVFFNNQSTIGLNGDSKMQSILDLVKPEVPEKSKKAPTDFLTVNVDCLVKKSDENGKLKGAAININLDKGKILLPLQIDTLSVLHVTTKTSSFYDILVESLCRTLRLIEENLVEQLSQLGELCTPETFHFKPENFGHFYTCIYPAGLPDDDDYLKDKRKELHGQFGLPGNRPYFRRANRYQYGAREGGQLVNPHVGLKASIAGGKQSLVQGNYTYHHYMQDGFNDDGWGCAYRSLQTLCSWFRFQGYSDTPIPTHEEIQKYLVKIGDKDKSFVGSRQWIGSTEVSMCLNGLMGVDSRIMHVGSGAELASKGSELAYHFETQGTPIMIGGGVLAHTILGVDFNCSTGELKFLILDPHYTGAEELSVIQNKGWCNWKTTNFWDVKSYYNLCMPQRPNLF
jgi:hypothetical protein